MTSSRTILEQTIAIARLHSKAIDQISYEARVNRSFTANWIHPDRGAQLAKVEAVLHACGYQLTIRPIGNHPHGT